MCRTLGIDPNTFKTGLMEYQQSNGRMQEFSFNGIKWKLNLVKNPAGGERDPF